MATGKIKFWNEDRGYGFIARDDGEADVFIHFRALTDQHRDYLMMGERVRFETGVSPKSGKVEAQNVVVL